MKKTFFITILLMTLGLFAIGQVSFVFVPEIHGRSVDGLGMFQIQNMKGQNLTGQATITVTEVKTKNKIVEILTPFVTLRPGLNSFPKNDFVNSLFKFSQNSYASITSQTRNFPAGEYSFCYSFTSQDKNEEGENCFDGMVQPLVPVTLISPADKDMLCNKRPPLTWQPPLPFSASTKFRLLLTEKKAGAAVENILMNTPIVLQDNILATSINYPISSPDLKEGKSYCWQVVAYQNDVILSQSEVWEFTVACSEPNAISPNDSYRELKSLVNGNYYIANRFFKFSFTNNYNVTKLNCTILNLETGLEVKHVPVIDIQQGLNKIDIDLTDLNLETSKHYILKVYPFNEPAAEVRFVYKDEK